MGSDVFAAGANNGSSVPTMGTTSTPAVHPDTSGATKQTLLGTYFQSGDSISPVTGGSTPLDTPNKVTCPAGQTCTITATISVQVGGNSTDENRYGVNSKIDGDTAGESPILGEIPTDGSYAGDTWTSEQTGVAAGKHTVESYLYTDYGATLGLWSVTYSLYD
jgi:hypothetical protein